MKSSMIIQAILIFLLLIAVNVLSQFFYAEIDLTADKRFTLTEQTEELLESVEDNVFVRVYLEGEDFPAGFRRLQNELKQILKDFRQINPRISYEFVDPLQGSPEQQKESIKNMMKDGMTPVRLMVSDGNSSSEKRLFPYAEIIYGSRSSAVNLLQSQSPGEPQEVTLNNSIALLEYKLTNTIQHILKVDKPNVLFLQGHGELEKKQVAALESELRRFYNTAHSSLDSLYAISPRIDVLVVAKPRTSFSEREKFMLDQYLMNGGSMVWLVDVLNLNLDSLNRNPVYIPNAYDLNLDDFFFKYGIRFNADLVLDLQCTKIPIAVGQSGGQPNLQMVPWFYHLVVSGNGEHPISTNIGRLNLQFAGSIDTVKTASQVYKRPLLESSQYTRIQRAPMRLGFGMAHANPDPDKFNQGPQTLAWLLEGEFTSLYRNRVPASFKQTLDRLNTPFKAQGSEGKIIVVSDGDMTKNLYNTQTDEYSAMGYNKWENFVFGGHKDFLLNAIDYLVDESGVMKSRGKSLKLRILDKVRAKKEKTKWQVINIVAPLVVFLVFGWLNHLWRKKKYTV